MVAGIDMLRVFLINAVVVGHVLRFFETNSFGIELFEGRPAAAVNVAMTFGHQYTIPSLIFLTGVTSALSYQRIHSKTEFVTRRSLRLLPPLLCGLVFFVIPKQYLTVEECGGVAAPTSIVFFYPFYLTRCFTSMGFEWLWFLVVQTAVSVVHVPFLSAVFDSSSLRTRSAFVVAATFVSLSGSHLAMVFTAIYVSVVLLAPLRTRSHVASLAMFLIVVGGRVALSALPWPPSALVFALVNVCSLFALGVLAVACEGVFAAIWRTAGLQVLLLVGLAALPVLTPWWDNAADEPVYFQAAGIWQTYDLPWQRVVHETGKTLWACLLYAVARVAIQVPPGSSSWAWNFTRRTLLMLYIVHPLPLFAVALYVKASWRLDGGAIYLRNVVALIALTYGLTYSIIIAVAATPFRTACGYYAPAKRSGRRASA